MSLGIVSNDQPLFGGTGADAIPRLTVVVPLFNESELIERLRNELLELQAALA